MTFSYFKKSVQNIRQLAKLIMNKVPVERNVSSHVAFSSSSENTLKPLFSNMVDFQVLPTPLKGDSDKKEYRVIRLTNGLTACLIADPQPDKSESDESEGSEESEGDSESGEESGSDDGDDDDDDDPARDQKLAAASLSIGVGSFSDPKDIPGMAHFLEHMVFMGSEKFPEENDFDSFISKRGGSDNASTDCEVTTFYFECLDRDLFTALDKFAQFFISPLMKRGSITREREAIESEFQMALPSDSYRKEQLIASFANDKSPVNTFTWGNLQTLRDNVSEDKLYDELHKFRKRHYSAHRMTLAIQARLPMHELESYVLECFHDVPSNDLPPDDFRQFTNVFDNPNFTKLYYVQPVGDFTQVDLTWALPPLLEKYKSKPLQYVSWFLGDEGKGSLLSYLKKKVWVLSITAGNAESGSEFNSIYAIFTITMTLTVEGLDHLDEVIETVFSYISMLRKLGPQERPYNEMKLVADNSFKFATEQSAAEVVEDLSENMQFYPPEHYLIGSELFLQYDPEAIKKILDALVPEKMNVLVLSKKLPSGVSYDKTEKWFGTKYAEKEIPKQWMKKWQKAAPRKEFAIPPPNVFLTEDFSLVQEDDNHPDYPKKVLSTELVEMWYRKDQKFKLPVAFYNFYFINPLVLRSPKSAALTDFYMTLVQISVDEEAYPAQAARLGYSFKNYDKGLLLSVTGYNEKLHLLIELITKHFINFDQSLTEEMFKAVKDKLIKYYYNHLLKPGNLGTDIRLGLLVNNRHSIMDKYNAAASLIFDDIKNFSQEFLSRLFIKSLVQGNVTKELAINVVNNLVTTLHYKPIDPCIYPHFRVTQVPKGETFCVTESFNTSDSNSIITNYYQSGPFSLKESVAIEIILLIIQEPLFDTLRTKEQLGYDVSCSSRDTFGILGFSITVNAQATKNDSSYVETRIEVFVNQVSELLANMTEESYLDIKKDLIKMKRCCDVELKEEVNRNWSEICDEDYMFDRIKREISQIDKLTLKEVRDWWAKHTNGESDLRKLSIQVSGFKNVNEEVKKEERDPQNVNLKLNFIDYGNNKVEREDREQHFVKDLKAFKENLFLFPVVCKCPEVKQ